MFLTQCALFSALHMLDCVLYLTFLLLPKGQNGISCLMQRETITTKSYVPVLIIGMQGKHLKACNVVALEEYAIWNGEKRGVER